MSAEHGSSIGPGRVKSYKLHGGAQWDICLPEGFDKSTLPDEKAFANQIPALAYVDLMAITTESQAIAYRNVTPSRVQVFMRNSQPQGREIESEIHALLGTQDPTLRVKTTYGEVGTTISEATYSGHQLRAVFVGQDRPAGLADEISHEKNIQGDLEALYPNASEAELARDLQEAMERYEQEVVNQDLVLMVAREAESMQWFFWENQSSYDNLRPPAATSRVMNIPKFPRAFKFRGNTYLYSEVYGHAIVGTTRASGSKRLVIARTEIPKDSRSDIISTEDKTSWATTAIELLQEDKALVDRET